MAKRQRSLFSFFAQDQCGRDEPKEIVGTRVSQSSAVTSACQPDSFAGLAPETPQKLVKGEGSALLDLSCAGKSSSAPDTKHELPCRKMDSVPVTYSTHNADSAVAQTPDRVQCAVQCSVPDTTSLDPPTAVLRQGALRQSRFERPCPGSSFEKGEKKIAGQVNMRESKTIRSAPLPAGRADDSANATSTYDWLCPAQRRDCAGRRPGDVGYDSCTVLIPKASFERMSRTQQQYWSIKHKYMDTVLFFKVGSFYELYELDADIGHKELEWKLTLNGVGRCKQVGISESSIDQAVMKLVARGYRVGRVEQIETGEEAKAKRGPNATVLRKLTRVLSAATNSEEDLCPDAVHLLALAQPGDGGGTSVPTGFAFLDASAACLFVGSVLDDSFGSALKTLLAQVSPQEVLYNEASPAIKRFVRSARGPGGSTLPTLLSPLPPSAPNFPTCTQAAAALLSSLGLEEQLGGLGFRRAAEGQSAVQGPAEGGGDPPDEAELEGIAKLALAMLLCHMQRLQWEEEQIRALKLLPYSVFSSHLRLDGSTMSNLELLENTATGQQAGTLFAHLNTCATNMGQRLLRRWICHPLRCLVEIERRLAAVDELISQPKLPSHIHSMLRELPDLERMLGRVRALAVPLTAGKALPTPLLRERELRRRVSLFGRTVEAFGVAMTILQNLSEADCTLPAFSAHAIPTEGKRGAPLKASLLLDLISRAHADGGAALAAITALTNAITTAKPRVPRKGAKRPKVSSESPDSELEYQLSPLQQDECPSLNGNETDAEAQEVLLSQHLLFFLRHQDHWAAMHGAIAQLDVLSSFALAAMSSPGPTCRPTFIRGHESKGGASKGVPGTSPGVFQARALWHPYSVGGGGGAVVPNDLFLGGHSGDPNVSPKHPEAILLTGPNMGGKSTLLRATCIAVVMAQMGCHVAAQELTLSPADVVFTRIGASDRILSGQSTFLVECQEASRILQDATPHSLVVLDELGRGTSTFDGFAIAHSVLEYVTTRIGCRLLFATHYNALSLDFTSDLRGKPIGFLYMDSTVRSKSPFLHSIKTDANDMYETTTEYCEEDVQLTFLYKLREGVCPKSYGLQVASMAGIPLPVVRKASQVAEDLEHSLKGKFGRCSEPGDLRSGDWDSIRRLCHQYNNSLAWETLLRLQRSSL